MGKTLQDNSIGNDFLNRRSLIAQEIKARIDIWDYIKLKTSAQQRKQSME
jgi:hypothetical protein